MGVYRRRGQHSNMAFSLKSIPFVPELMEKVPHLDYEGQRLAERIYQVVIILFSVVGFIWGYVCQQFEQTVLIIGAGCTLAAILVLIPWPFYRRHSLNWVKDDDMKSKRKAKSKKNKS